MSNQRKIFQVKLTYFKASGKYYADGEYQVEAGAIVMGEGTPEAHTIAYTYDVLDAVALMDSHPGLSCRWTEGPILVTGPEMSPPHLITDLEGLARRARQKRDTDVAIKRTEEALGRSPGTLGRSTDDAI